MRILHPTDFSQPAQQALGLARDLRQRTGGTLHIVHAQRRADAGRPYGQPQLDTLNPEMLNKMAEQRSEQVDRLLGMLSHLASPDATFELLWGHPVEELLRVAADYDVVVMGAHGANRLDRYFLGGVAGRLVRRTDTPIISVREESKATSVRRMLVGVDFLDASNETWAFASRFADAGIDLMLAHVVDESADAVDTSALTEKMSAMSGGKASRLLVRQGNAISALPQLAEEVGADVIVIGLRHRRGAAGLLLGSRADALLRSSPTPIMTVPLAVD